MVNAATKASGFFAKGLVVGQGNGLDRHQIWHCRDIVNVLTCSEVVAFDGWRRSEAWLRVKQHGSRSSRLWLKQETSGKQAGDKQETSRRQAGDKQESAARWQPSIRSSRSVPIQCRNATRRGDQRRASRCGPVRTPAASDGSLRKYLARLLDGFFSEQAIMVVAPCSSETRREEAPQQEPMHLLDGVRLLRSALVRRNVHVHGLATAGAMTLDRRRSYRTVGALAGWRYRFVDVIRIGRALSGQG
jgi:hypothetical protein